ncbi:hypothetical protein [Nocardioides yefusunii]|uniref:Uncharacterized protein n=1 Tax=Nocardioides yefusunii TaxID=2500546 RepID=A0ABW1QXH5_9ACTN|nr:hypothetical protein [Nocardioides yefusunii]
MAETVFTGLGTALIAPAQLNAAVRRGLHGATALAGAAGTALVVSQQEGQRSRAVPAGVAAGAVLLGVSVVGVKLDASLEQWLRRRGVKRPRVWMGAVAGAVTLVSAWAGDFSPEVTESEIREGAEGSGDGGNESASA